MQIGIFFRITYRFLTSPSKNYLTKKSNSLQVQFRTSKWKMQKRKRNRLSYIPLIRSRHWRIQTNKFSLYSLTCLIMSAILFNRQIKPIPKFGNCSFKSKLITYTIFWGYSNIKYWGCSLSIGCESISLPHDHFPLLITKRKIEYIKHMPISLLQAWTSTNM